MDSATEAISKGLRPGTLVSYETTLPVGTTRGRWVPMLEERIRSRGRQGLPRRLQPGAGADRPCVRRPAQVPQARRWHRRAIGATRDGVLRGGARLRRAGRPRRDANGVWDLGSAEAAELAKLAETTYRDVNIGLANQFARYADSIDVDVAKVIDACNSQPYSHIHRPGIAVGGHCIPIYPRIYLWNDPAATVVRAAREANAAMPAYAVDCWPRRSATSRTCRSGARRRVPRRGQGDGVLRCVRDRRRPAQRWRPSLRLGPALHGRRARGAGAARPSW